MADGDLFIALSRAENQANLGNLSPVRTASIPWAVFKALTGRACLPLIRFILVVLRTFIVPQLVARLAPHRHIIVGVDHPLDERIPFEPQRVGIYLSFVQVWIRGLSLVRRQFGRSVNRDIAQFLNDLSQAYIEARSIYRRCLSTTQRPKNPVNRQFRLIYTFDPHFNCVPSLHIVVVCQTFLEIEKIYARHGQSDLGAEAVADLYAQAVSISESVVFVKQHSINCISAALFMISNLQPEFGRVQVKNFVAELFKEQLPEADRQAILDHVISLYSRFMTDPRSGTSQYTDVLVDFLHAHPPAQAVLI